MASLFTWMVVGLALPAHSKDPVHPEITGVWAVTLKYERGSCPDVGGGSAANVWTFSRDTEGRYSVALQGEGNFKSLTGGDDAGVLRFLGTAGSSPRLSAAYELQGSASRLSGTLIETRITKYGPEKVTWLGTYQETLTCAIIWSVEAQKQGK